MSWIRGATRLTQTGTSPRCLEIQGLLPHGEASLSSGLVLGLEEVYQCLVPLRGELLSLKRAVMSWRGVVVSYRGMGLSPGVAYVPSSGQLGVVDGWGLMGL